MAGPVNLVVVSGSRLFREGLRLIVSSTKLATSGSAASFAHALELLKSGAVQADLLIGDPAPSFEEEYQALATLRHEFPTIRIVILTRSPTVLDAEHAVQYGVAGLFSQSISAEALKQALDLVLMSGAAGSVVVIFPPQSTPEFDEAIWRIGPQIDGALAAPEWDAPDLEDDLSETDADEPDSSKSAQLSGREKQTLECLVNGMPNKLIARHLNISDATVKVHLRSLLRKLRLQNRTQAAIWAMQNVPAPARLTIVPGIRVISEQAAPRFDFRAAPAPAPAQKYKSL